MIKSYEILQRCSLFKALTNTQIEQIIQYLSPVKRNYKKGEILFLTGSTLYSIGIVISGGIQILKEDTDGNSIILARIHPGDMFGEGFVYSGEPTGVTAKAAEPDSNVMYISGDALFRQNDCPYSNVIMSNLIGGFARKNLFLTRRIEHLTRHTLADKVMSYLGDCALQNGSKSFVIPFDRQAMADYLAADRSALSNVLSKLKKDGKIDFHKNYFTLL